jgi:hypothetical protein
VTRGTTPLPVIGDVASELFLVNAILGGLHDEYRLEWIAA